MARWAWYTSDLSSGARTGSLSVGRWEHEDLLDDTGQFNITLTSQGQVLDRNAIDITAAARSVITPYRDGRVLGYAGIVWRADPPHLAGSSLLSYFDTQAYSATTIFTNVDQHTIIKTLVDWVQLTALGGNIRVDTSQIGTSGVLRDQTWNAWEAKNVGEAIRQKSDNIGGFDFDVRVEDDGVRRMRLWTPRRGRVFQAQASPVFTVGRNARTIPQAPADGAGMATVVVALGEETNPTTHERLQAVSTRADLIAQGYPRLVKVLDLPDVKDLTTLQEHADGYASNYGAVVIDQIVLEVDPDDVTWPWGSWDLGDDCQVVIPTPRPAEYTIVPAVPAHISFPGPTAANGNYAQIPVSAPADPSADWRVEFKRPPMPASGDTRMSSDIFYTLFSTTGISALFFATDASFPSIAATTATLDSLGFPSVGSWMQTRTVWDATADTLTGYFRLDISRDLTDDAGWVQWGTGSLPGKIINGPAGPNWVLAGTTAVTASNGPISRWLLYFNGALHRDVNMATDIPANLNASSFTATTGQTVTVFRSGTPSTKLVAAVPGYRLTTDAGQAGDPWWPTGFNQTRRIVGHRWTVEGATERLEVITGRLFGT